MICKKCGRELADDAKFCGICGTPAASLSEFTAPAPAVAQPEPIPAPQPEPAAEAPVQTPAAPSPAPGYAPSAYTPPRVDLDAPLSLGQFLCMDLILLVPLLNLVMLVLWSFGTETNANRKNWARSRLIWLGIAMVAVIFILVLALLGSVTG